MNAVTIYWKTEDANVKQRIREKFHIPPGMTINGETSFEIREEDMGLLLECQSRGFLKIRNKL